MCDDVPLVRHVFVLLAAPVLALSLASSPDSMAPGPDAEGYPHARGVNGKAGDVLR